MGTHTAPPIVPHRENIRTGCMTLEESSYHPNQKEIQKHTIGGIPRWSPTLVLVARFSAYVRQSGRDAQFSLTYGRMC
jgi:hypothetical protein